MLIVNAKRNTQGTGSGAAESLIAVERRRIAREVHDRVGNQLAYLKLQIQSDRASRGAATLKRAVESLDRISTSIHEIIYDLRDDGASHQGLAILIGAMVEEWRQHSRFAIDFDARGEFSDIDISIAFAIIDFIREAMTNVTKHARGARRVMISLVADAEHVRFAVIDDGDGFDVEAARAEGDRSSRGGHFGLVGMRERAAELGGGITISASPEAGTTIAGIIPIGGKV